MTYNACQWLMTILVVWLSDDFMNAGNLALAMSVTNFFSIIAMYNTRIFQVSDIKEVYSDSVYISARVLTCAASFVLCVVFVLVAGFTATQRLIVIFYMLFRVNESFVDVLHGIDQKNWRMDYVGISFAARGILMLAVFVVLTRYFGLLPAVIGMTAITTFVCIVYDIQKTKKLTKLAIYVGKQIFSLLERCFLLMLVMLILTLIISYTRISLERILGTEALGIYATVIAPAMLIQISAFLIFTPLAKPLADCLSERNRAGFFKIIALASALIIGFTAAFTAASAFFGEWGLGILSKWSEESMVPYAYIMPGAAISAGLTAFLWFMNMIFSVTRDIKGIFFGNLVGLIVCLAITDAFLNRYGIIGANHIMIVSQGVIVLLLIARLFWYVRCKSGLFNTQST